MIRWLICKLWGHKFVGEKVGSIYYKNDEGERVTKGLAKECKRCGQYIVVIML